MSYLAAGLIFTVIGLVQILGSNAICADALIAAALCFVADAIMRVGQQVRDAIAAANSLQRRDRTTSTRPQGEGEELDDAVLHELGIGGVKK